MFIKNEEIMTKTAVFRLKLSFPNVSGLALHQWNYQVVETVAWLIYAINKLEIKFKGFEVHARLCTQRRGNGRRSLNRMAGWCQVEISVAFPGASVAHYLQRASFPEPKRRRLSDQPY